MEELLSDGFCKEELLNYRSCMTASEDFYYGLGVGAVASVESREIRARRDEPVSLNFHPGYGRSEH